MSFAAMASKKSNFEKILKNTNKIKTKKYEELISSVPEAVFRQFNIMIQTVK